MTALKTRIIGQIEAGGPMPVSTFMALCLLDPDYGYYTTRPPFGAEGDFTTAPEISQMFGELISIWALTTWDSLGRPAPFVLAEAGPGRGTLMNDLLRASRAEPAFHNAMQLHLIEASPRLTEIQRQTLAVHGKTITWCETLDALPNLPTFLIGNELLDALPMRQAVKTRQGWQERCVGLDDKNDLIFMAGPTAIDTKLLPNSHAAQAEGAIFEFAPAREAFVSQLSAHIKDNDGAALMIDYGHTQPGFGDTLQAVKNHRFTDVLAEPGAADLTSHVDFSALADIANAIGIRALSPMTQGDFLLQLGLLERAGALGAGKDTGTQEAIRSAVERLAGDRPNQMGKLFKVLCLTNSQTPLFPFESN